MRMRVRHILITLLVGVGLTLGVTTLLATSSQTGRTTGDGILCVVPSDGPAGPFPACDQVFTSVQEAIDGAVAGQEVRVASGVYTDVHTRDGVAQIAYISKSISIHGGYAPPFDASPDPLVQPTTLDAQGQGRVVYITGDISATLTGLRITGGDAGRDQGRSSRFIGGGVYAISATVTVSASQVYGNSGSQLDYGKGGGLAFISSDVTLLANVIRGNTGGLQLYGAGGGLLIIDSQFNLVGNQILSNTAVIRSGPLAFGGGVAISDGSGWFTSNQINGNLTAGGFFGVGGGVYIETFEPGRVNRVVMQDNYVQNNVAGLQDGEGGGVRIKVGQDTSLDVQLLDNVIQNNVAAVARGTGGGFWMAALTNSTATLTLRYNHLLSNTASLSWPDGGLGGGIATRDVAITSEGNHIVGNRAGDASAFCFWRNEIRHQGDILSGNVISRSDGGVGSSVIYDESQATASNLVIIDNQGSPHGAAISVYSSTVKLVHSTLARNNGGSGISVGGCLNSSCSPSTAALTNTILVSHAVGIRVTDGSTVTADGVLWYQAPITVSKGPAAVVTITHQVIGDPLFAADGYHLTAGSAAIGRGVPTSLQVDIDNEVRPLAPALGADEYWADKAYLPLILRE